MWQEQKTDYENAARKIRKLKSIIRSRKVEFQQLKKLDKKHRKQIKKLEELIDMQDALLTVFTKF